MAKDKPEDIREWTFRFVLTIISLVDSLPNTTSANTMGKQLIRSGTSIGANVEEATAAHTKNDFIYRMGVALREARETLYWLRLLDTSRLLKERALVDVLQEADEITRILGAIVSSARVRETPDKFLVILFPHFLILPFSFCIDICTKKKFLVKHTTPA